MKISVKARESERRGHAPPLFDRIGVGLAGSAVLIFAVYSRSLGFQFILDDHRFTADPRMQESGHVWDYFANYVWAQFSGGPASFYRPLFLLWVRLNFAVSALSPWGWHLFSIAKHVAVAALLGVVAWKFLRDGPTALLAAMLFALHPAQTESVSWVTVPDPLMAGMLFVSLLCYLRYLEGSRGKEQQHGRKARRSSTKDEEWAAAWLIGAVMAYLAALLTKETAIVFPSVLMALDFCVSKRSKRAQDNDVSVRWKRTMLHVAPFAIATGVYLLLRWNALNGKLGAATQHLSWRTVFLSWPSIAWFYLKVIFWPVRSYSFADPILIDRLSVRGVLVPLAEVISSAGVLAAAGFWIWRKARKTLIADEADGVEFAVVVGMLLLTLPLLPAFNLNGLNPGDFLHGRYTYLPLGGLMLLAAVGWRVTKRRRVLAGVVAGLLIMFSGLTWAQEEQWRDDSSVFARAHELAPHNVPVRQHLADTQVEEALRLDQEGRCGDAVPMFERVNGEFPQDWYAWAGLGDCYVQLNNLPKAEEALHRASEISHDPRVMEQWQELRARMGLPGSALSK